MEDALAEAVRVSERALDHQLASLLAERSDLERLMRLGIAGLAGTLAGAGLLVQSSIGVAALPVFVLAMGILVLIVATAVAGGAASPSEIIVGPDVKGMYEALGRGSIDAKSLRFSLLDQATVAQRHNVASLQRAARRRAGAGRLLFSGAGLVFIAFSYVVGGAILV